MWYDKDIKRTVSYKGKIRKNFARQKKLMNGFNMYWFDSKSEQKRYKRLKINYDLANGIVDDDIYNAPLDLTVEGQSVEVGYSYVAHHPLVAKVTEAAVGEELLMPFEMVVKDTSVDFQTAKKDEKTALLKQFFNLKYSEPLREQVATEMLGSGENIAQLTPEQAQQVSEEIESRVKDLTPEKITEYIENDFKSLAEIQGQRLLNYLTKYLDLKRVKNQGFENAFIVAEPYYLVGINNGEPTMEVVNPDEIEYAPSPNSPWINDAMYALRRQEVTIQEAFALDGESFTNKDIKKLADMVHGYGYNFRQRVDPSSYVNPMDEEVIFELDVDPSLREKYSGINLSTKHGQDKLMALYDDVLGRGKYRSGQMYLTRSYIAWRDMAYFKRVKFREQSSGEIQYRWESEDYTLNPNIGDISLKQVEKPEVWHGVMYGYGENAVYVKIEPLPNQRKSLENISDVTLPFFGGKMNTKNGQTENRSNVDRGKQWNYNFDLQMAEIKAKQASNFGQVFAMLKELKPRKMPWGEWMTTMKHLKIMILQGTVEEGNIDPNLLQVVKGVDLSTMNDIAASINLLQFFKTQLGEDMHFSQERLGRIGQYMTASTSKDAISASEVQTTRLYDTHNWIFTQAVQYLLDVTRTAYKNNPPKRNRVMGYVEAAELELDWEMLARAELGVFVSISPADVIKIKQIKERTQEIIQNQMMDIEDLFKFEMVETPAELMNLGTVISKKRQAAQQQAQDAEAQRVQQAIAAEKERFEMEYTKDKELKAMDIEGKKDFALIDSMKFANQADINENKENDFMEMKRMELASNERISAERLRSQERIKDKELEIKKQEVRIKELELELKQKEAKQNKQTKS